MSITYLEPDSGRTLTTEPVPFELIRAANLSVDLIQVNPVLDLQRNRIEAANALKLAMQEQDYKCSRAILQAQVEKVKASISAQDPFCQTLIDDLQHLFPSESEYRSSHHNTSQQHHTERGTHTTPYSSSTAHYRSRQQNQLAAHYVQKYT